MSDNVSTLALALESNQFNAGLRHSQTLMRSLGAESGSLTTVLQRTGAAMAGLVVGSKAMGALTSSIRAASAYREDLAQFDHVMRNVTKTADNMVKTLTSDAFGRTNMQARQMLMGMTSLAKGMGITDKAAVELSGKFSKMAIDMGSFQMRDPDAIMGAFQSALMGNTMALRSYQVHLSEATLKETIAANAKKGMVFASARQARAYAVLTEAQKQQADAIGDYAVEAANFGNQLRKFYGGLSELPALFGKGLLEPANEFLKVANSAIDTMRKWDESTWKFISTATALGTAVGIGAAGYVTLKAAVGAYTIAKGFATAASAAQTAATGKQTIATAGATAAITAETAALTANTAARTANAKAAAAGRVATMDRWNTSVAKARVVAESGFGNMPSSRDEKMFLWNANVSGAKDETAARMRNRQMMRNRWDSKVAAVRNTGRTGTATDALAVNVLGTGSWRNKKITHRSVTSQHGASRRSRAYINAMAIKRRGNARRRQHLYNAPTRGLRRVGRGIGGVAAATVGRLPGAGLITGLVKQIGGVIVRLAPTFFTRLGTMALTAINPIGWGVAILTGLSVVGNYLPTLMYKAYDGFVSLFSSENMQKIWDTFSTLAVTCWNKTFEYIGKGFYGIGLVAESIFYTAVNTLGNLFSGLIYRISGGLVNLGTFEYKSSGYAAYEQQKKTNEMQARLDDQRAEQAKIEKRISEIRGKVVEQERLWLDKELDIMKKRSELAEGRFDSYAKEDSLALKLPITEMLASSVEAAIPAVQSEIDRIKDQLDTAKAKGSSPEELDKIEERLNAATARKTTLMGEKEKYAIEAMEQRYSSFDSKFENAGKQKGDQNQMLAYSTLMSDVSSRSGVENQQKIESEYESAYRALGSLQRKYMESGDEALQEEIENAKKRVQTAETAYNELQESQSDQRKIQEQMDTLRKEQNKRYQEAQSNLWDFNFDHAPKSVQQQMARKSFFNAQNQFEGAQTDEERGKAFQDMQSMYGKMDKQALEMPEWNGFIRTTAGAIESDSVAAQELQERILNDFNKVLVDEARKQSVMQSAMQAAMEQVVKNTDPSMQPSVGGSV